MEKNILKKLLENNRNKIFELEFYDGTIKKGYLYEEMTELVGGQVIVNHSFLNVLI